MRCDAGMILYLVTVDAGEYWQQWMRSSCTTCDSFPRHDMAPASSVSPRLPARQRPRRPAHRNPAILRQNALRVCLSNTRASEKMKCSADENCSDVHPRNRFLLSFVLVLVSCSLHHILVQLADLTQARVQADSINSKSSPTSPCQRPSKALQRHYSQNKGSTNSSLKWPQGKGPQ
jgi:hypothetical protein